MIRRLLVIWLLLGFGGTLAVHAQGSIEQSANVIQGKKLDWKFISSEFFDVYYYTADPGLAQQAAKHAEESLYDICRFLDYKNSSRFAIYLYISPFDLIQSNQYPADKIKEGGITPVRNNTIGVVYGGSGIKLHQRIKTAASALLIEDFYYGGTVQASIQNSVLLHTPKWFAEGLPAFMGEGWTYEDELWITSLEKENILDYALEGDEYIHHIARKSIWYYIVSQYGPEKLTEIFYMTRLTRSVDAGIIHVLGITLKTLTERWWEATLQRISENHEYRTAYTDNAQQLKVGKNERIVGFALNPKQPLAAVYTLRKGIHRLKLYNVKTGEWTDTGIKSGFKTDQLDQFQIDMPMAWSHDGNRLIATFFHNSEEEMVIYDHAAKVHTFVPFRPGLERIMDISFSHDNKFIVVSGLKQGMVDLYMTAPGNSRFKQLTNDIYDDLNPVWSLDDQKIIYGSTRNTDSLGGPQRYDHFIQPTDLYALDMGEKGTISRITSTPRFSELPLKMLSSFELAYSTDQSGIFNVMRKNIFLGDSVFLTNFTQGFYDLAATDSLVGFSIPQKGRMNLYVSPLETVFDEPIVLDTRLRYNDNLQYQKSLKLEKMQQEIDSIRKVKEEQSRPNTTGQNTPPDTVTTSEPKVKYYVFDDEGEDDNAKPVRRKTVRNKTRNRTKTYIRPDFDTTATGPAQTGKTKWAASRVASQFSFDPIFKLNMLLEAQLTDLAGDRRVTVGFRPFIDLKSSDFYANYASLKRKVDIYAGISRSARYLNRDEFQLRYNSIRADGQLVYPLNRFLSVGAGVHGVSINRLNLDPFRPDKQDSTGLLAGGSVFMTYDSRKTDMTFIRSGDYVSFSASNAYSIYAKTHNFLTFQADIRHYQPVAKRMVLATKFHGAFSMGNSRQQFFMGGVDEWLFGNFQNPADLPVDQEISKFHYMQYATPVRGFLFNSRNGSKYMAASAELRIPISRLTAKALNTNPIYNFELVPFFDVGTAWEEGNPLSQKNPIDTEVIDSYPLNIRIQTLKSPFIMGFGGGARMQIFGYSVRMDLAWGLEDYTILDPKLHMTLSKDF